MKPEIQTAIDALLASVNDDNRHGGLLSRDTVRRADELRVALAVFGDGRK